MKSDEFFGVDNTPNLVFKSIGDRGYNVYAVTADLTIKGATNPAKLISSQKEILQLPL